jgi:hypothetical protein
MQMKKPLKARLLELIAALCLGVGGVLFVTLFLPILNAPLFEPAPVLYYLVVTPLSLLLLGSAWYFNLRALRLRGEIT